MYSKKGGEPMVAAACHVHSEWSYDATWSLFKLASEFGRNGFRVVMLTEHDRGFCETRRLMHRDACAKASTESVLLVPGIEYSDPDNVIHILVWGPVPFLGEGRPTLEMLKAVKDHGGVAVMAHPSRRSAWQRFDPVWCNYLLGMEIWNRKTDGWAPSSDAQRLIAGTALMPFVCLDFHAQNQMFPLSMALDIGGEIDESSVLNSFRARACKPVAFSEPVYDVLNGWQGMALKPAEKLRRTSAFMYRSLRTLGHVGRGPVPG
jgi:hypothetical protein